MFDKTFFKFAVIFSAIIAVSMVSLAFSGYLNQKGGEKQTAALSTK